VLDEDLAVVAVADLAVGFQRRHPALVGDEIDDALRSSTGKPSG
jgi:hypothetical protein